MTRQAQGSSTPWGPEQKIRWFANQRVQRSYRDDVLAPLEAMRPSLAPGLLVEGYGNLTIDPERFPLFAVRTAQRDPARPTVLITGGVHGYETSGVKGALLFLREHARAYAPRYNLVVAPCISPWSYETINRLDPIMENPNREFRTGSQAEESRLLMAFLQGLNVEFDAHIDLHETTDSDKRFIPEEFSKNGKIIDADTVDIPDGFYLIGTEGAQRRELEQAMMAAVGQVTHIAQAENGKILNTQLSSPGVIHLNIPGLCAELTAAKTRLGAYTTEMYPDSPRFRGQPPGQVEQLCSEAQVACVRGALDFWSAQQGAPNC